MKKRKPGRLAVALCMMALLFAATLAAIYGAAITPVDVGNHNDYGDYGGGGGGGYDYGGNDYNYGGNDYGGSGSSGDLNLSSPVLIVIVIIAAVVVIVMRSKRGRSFSAGGPAVQRQPAAPPIANHDAVIEQAIKEIDPNFSREKFLGWAKEVFITLQQAWTARDWSKIRPFEKEELFRQHEMQLQEYINLHRINVIERINVNQAYLHRYQRDGEYEYLTVYLATRMNDYIIDENTRHVIKGDPNRPYFMNYLLTFMRKKGVVTDPVKSNKSTVSCPHCGAPVQITSAGRCEYCDFIITTGEHDWVLSNLDSVKNDTVPDNRGVIILPGGEAPSKKPENQNDPDQDE